MRVGTDAVLLGAWARMPVGQRVLDIGTGCGIVALMMAQRYSQAQVWGIDVDEASVDEAQENAADSPFADRITMQMADVREWRPEATFDAIVCNPPFFTEDTLPPDERRSRARNASALSFAQLVKCVDALLSPQGEFSVVIPTWEVEKFVAECAFKGLYLCRRTDVRTVPRKAPKRTLLAFTRKAQPVVTDTLALMDADGSRSGDYCSLASAFYL